MLGEPCLRIGLLENLVLVSFEYRCCVDSELSTQFSSNFLGATRC